MPNTFLLGWCPDRLDTTYLPFATGVGVEAGSSDPVFMQRQRLRPRPDEGPVFQLDLDAFRACLAAGKEQGHKAFALGTGCLGEANSGRVRL